MLKTVCFVSKPENVTYKQVIPHLLSFFKFEGSGKLVCTKRLLSRYVPLLLNHIYHLGDYDMHVVNPGRMGTFSDKVTCVISPGSWTEEHIGSEFFVSDDDQILVIVSGNLWRFLHVLCYECRMSYAERLDEAGVNWFVMKWDKFAKLYPISESEIVH